MRVVFVTGDFNDDGGRPSGFANKLQNGFRQVWWKAETSNRAEPIHHKLVNGGTYEQLEALLKDEEGIKGADVVFWMPNVPNDKPKLVGEIKKINPTCMLVISKNNFDEKYQPIDLVSRGLAAKANLLIEFTKGEGCFLASVIDPLGNLFVDKEGDIDKLAQALWARLVKLASFTRLGSGCVGEEPIAMAPNEAFIGYIRQFADRFHLLIHAANPTRFLGNASFRCDKGFPSMRDGDKIFVTRRNLDKRDLGPEGFVAVDSAPVGSTSRVNYHGPMKPSVDTPIQRELYAYYRNVNFMVHSHVYVENAPFTSTPIPCGALEEAAAIQQLFPWPDMPGRFAVNLLGHGSIIFAENVEELDGWEFVARDTSEKQV